MASKDCRIRFDKKLRSQFINSAEYDKFLASNELFSKFNFFNHGSISKDWIFSL